MKIKDINCPTCGAPLPEDVKPNQQFSCSACNSALILTDLQTDNQVICAKCGTVNPDTKPFCHKCGESLQVPCMFCYVQNRVDAEYCRNCGANLEYARQRKNSWLNQERKQRENRWEAIKQAEEASRKAKLNRLLDDLDEPENHPMAIYQLHQFGDEAVDSLIAHLTDEDPDARFGAAQTLGLIGDPKAIPALIESLKDPEPAVRYWAVDSLAKLKAVPAVEALGALLDDKHKGVKEHAEQALAKIGGPTAAEILRKKRKRKWGLF